MTVGEWLASRTPPPPPALSARMCAALGDSLALPSTQVTEACLAAGERVASELLQNNLTTRDSALDLLAADALVTYAFEAAADAPDAVAARATDAMRRIAALGTHA